MSDYDAGWDLDAINDALDELADARATVTFRKRMPNGAVVIVAVVNGTEYEGHTAAEALLSWARRKA